MGILESLLNAEWVKDQVMHNTFEFWTWTIEVFLLTAAIFFGVSRMTSEHRREHVPNYFERRRIERKEREQEERERIERKERDRKHRREWAMGLNANLKATLLEISEVGVVDIPFDSKRDVTEFARDFSIMGEPTISYTHIGGEKARPVFRIRINDLGREVLDECRDVFIEVDEYERSKMNGSDGGEVAE